MNNSRNIILDLFQLLIILTFLGIIYSYFFNFQKFKSFLNIHQLIFFSTFIIYFALNFKFFSERTIKILNFSSKFFDITEGHKYIFSFCRIAFGIVLFLRSQNILEFHSPLDFFWWGKNTYFVLYLESIFALFLILGFFTQYTLIFFVVIMFRDGEKILSSATLANDIAGILGIFLFMVQSGSYLSIDYHLKKISNLRIILLYHNKFLEKNFVSFSVLVALFSYWCVCVFSLLMHINEPAWMTGIAGPQLLTNNYMSTYNYFFEYLFINSDLSVFLARMSLYIMMIWYLAILPFVLIGGYFRKFIIIWGILFFILSEFFLNLSALGKFEFILWAALFWPKNFLIFYSDNEKVKIFYDDKCNLCDHTVRFLNKIDIFNALSFCPASQSLAELKKINLSYEKAMEDLYGFIPSSNKLYGGYDFYLLITQKLLILLPLYPLLLVGKLILIGPKIYRFIAERRRKVFGRCLVRPKNFFDNRHEIFFKNSNTLHIKPVSLLITIIIFGLVYIYNVSVPKILGYSVHDKNTKIILKKIANNAHFFGIAPINVFNEADLKMAEHWFTFELVNKKKKKLVPNLNYDGTRLDYHKSDRLYFGRSLTIRRRLIRLNEDGKNCIFLSDNKMFFRIYKQILSVFLFQENTRIRERNYNFIYRQFYQKLPSNEKLRENKYIKHKTNLVCKINFKLNYPSLKITYFDNNKKIIK